MTIPFILMCAHYLSFHAFHLFIPNRRCTSAQPANRIFQGIFYFIDIIGYIANNAHNTLKNDEKYLIWIIIIKLIERSINSKVLVA